MPNWSTHIYIAEKVCEKINCIDKNAFIYGSVCPDLYCGWIVEDVSHILTYDETHFGEKILINGKKFKLPNFDRFITQNKENINDPIILGYLSHIMADYYFNYYTFKNKFIKNDEDVLVNIMLKDGTIKDADSEIARITKQNDFKILSILQLLSISTKKVNLTERIISTLKSLDIREDDIEKLNLKINEILSSNVKGFDETKMFYIEELNQITEEAIDFIENKIKQLINF